MKWRPRLLVFNCASQALEFWQAVAPNHPGGPSWLWDHPPPLHRLFALLHICTFAHLPFLHICTFAKFALFALLHICKFAQVIRSPFQSLVLQRVSVAPLAGGEEVHQLGGQEVHQDGGKEVHQLGRQEVHQLWINIFLIVLWISFIVFFTFLIVLWIILIVFFITMIVFWIICLTACLSA